MRPALIALLYSHPLLASVAIAGEATVRPLCGAMAPFAAEPKITTSAGDHFNAGNCYARVLGVSPRKSGVHRQGHQRLLRPHGAQPFISRPAPILERSERGFASGIVRPTGRLSALIRLSLARQLPVLHQAHHNAADPAAHGEASRIGKQ